MIFIDLIIGIDLLTEDLGIGNNCKKYEYLGELFVIDGSNDDIGFN